MLTAGDAMVLADSGARPLPIPMSYHEIAEDLADRIRRGDHAVGEQLPTYPELAAVYGVSVRTAARAVAVLIKAGWVIGKQGRGTFVAKR